MYKLLKNPVSAINGYYIKDITYSDSFSQLYMSPYTERCIFKRELQCVPNDGEVCANELTINNGIYIHSTNSLIFNETTKVYSLTVETVQGNHKVMVNSIYNFDVSCLELDLNQISLKKVGDYSVFPNGNDFGLSVFGSYQIIGADPSVGLSAFLGKLVGLETSCYMAAVSMRSKNLVLMCSSAIPYGSDLSSVQVNISSSVSNYKVFHLDPLFKDNLHLYDIKTYPDQSYLQDVTPLGYYSTPLVSFKINSTSDRSYYSFYDDIDNSLYLKTIPISGNGSETTFIASLSQISTTPTSYKIYYLSQSTVESASYITAKLNQFVNNIYNPTVICSVYLNDLPIVTLKYSESAVKNLESISLIYQNTESKTIAFPFGYVSGGGNSVYNFQVTSLVKPNLPTYNGAFELKSLIEGSVVVNYPIKNQAFVYDYKNKPKIYNIEYTHLESDSYIFRFYIKTPYGFDYFKSFTNIYGIETRVSGDSYDGVYEVFIQNNYVIGNVYVFDQTGQSSTSYSFGTILSAVGDKIIRFSSPANVYFDISSIQQVSFLYNELDVINQAQYNIMYFNYSNDVPRDTVFRLIPFSNINRHATQDNPTGFENSFRSTWNSTIELFQIEFSIEPNSRAGLYQYQIVTNFEILYSSSFNSQFKIKNTNLDIQGSVFKEINKIVQVNEINSSNKYGTIGFRIKIEDSVNGFKSGYIVIKGELDQSHYNFTFTSNDNVLSGGNRYLGEYEFKINISYPCVNQDYVIDQVKLYDSLGKVSIFSILPNFVNEKLSSIYNPFINYLNDSSINRLPLSQCAPIDRLDTTIPLLRSFSVSNSTIDVSNPINRLISFTFTAVDQESGLKNDVYPIVYLSGSNNKILECKSKIVSIDSSSASYYCEINLPFAFSPGSIILSVYGFINNHGLFGGYSTESLIKLNFSYMIDAIFVGNTPYISQYNEISEKGGDLWLIGSYLDSTKDVYIKYSDDAVSRPTKPADTTLSSAILVKGIKSTNKPFDVYVKTSSGSVSNTIKVIPVVYSYYLDLCNGNGIEYNNGKCICNSKWITVDNKSQCTIPNHYILTSTQVLPSLGGEIILNGWYGIINENPSLFINNKQIMISSGDITSNSIKATIEPGTLGPVQVNYTQNSITYSGIIYPYLSTEKECPAKCELNGECDKSTGKCICKSGFTGFDCLSPTNGGDGGGSDGSTEVDKNGTTTIKNQDLGFTISIDSIVELDINDNAVSTFNLSNNWIFVNKVDSVSTFAQTRLNQDLTTAPIYLVIEEVNDRDKDFTFAGNEFTVTKGGFKLSISISNWFYSSSLNRLQIQMSTDIKFSSSDCNNNNAEIESSSSYLPNNINYLKVIKNNRALYSRFQDRMLSNDKISTITTQLLPSTNENTIKVALNIPSRCIDECLIDPDFSLLLTSDYSKCNNSRKWVIVVAVVCGSVGLIAFIIGAYFVYKRSTFLKIKVYAFRKYLSK